jgi:GTP-binding protein HflX
VLLHVIDASHPGWEEQKEVVEEVLGELGLAEHPTILVFNKTDRLTHAEEEALAEQARTGPRPAVMVSTVEAGGVEPLRRLLHDRVRALRPEMRLVLPATDGAALAEVYRDGEVLEREDDGAEVRLRVRLPAPLLNRLRARGVEVEVAGAG